MMSRHPRKDESEDDEASEESQDKKKPKPQKQPKFDSKNLPKPTKLNRIVINISDCQYPVVKLVAKLLKWKVQTDPQSTDWDMWWTDNAVLPQSLFRMQHHQKINHFPGMYILARKNLLGKGLMKMKKQFPQQYNFFPLTWMLPSEYSDFRAYFESKPKGKSRTYIVKPEALSQGKGIFLTRRLEDLELGEHYVVQRYLHKPYLIEGLKFDFRIYVLLASVDPLRVYLYNEGLARFATEPYVIPTKENMEEVCMHLTNYAINKDNPNFVFNESAKDMSIGHKRSLTSVFELLAKQGLDVPLLKEQIKDILIKTFISGLPLIRHQYRSCQLENYAANMCFQVLGFDVLLTSKGQPYLLEVNHTPSFTTDTPLDELIKKNLILDSLVLMNINVASKTQTINARREETNNRVFTGKKTKLTPEEREAHRAEAQKIRDVYENEHLGGFEKIYPIADEAQMKQYQHFLEHSEKLYEDSTGIKRKPKQVKDKASEKVIVEKVQIINQPRPPKRSNSINRTSCQSQKMDKPTSSEEIKLVKQDSGFLPIIKGSDSPNHRQATPPCQQSMKFDYVKENFEQNQLKSAESFDLSGNILKQTKQLTDVRQIYENINKNYADYVLLKEGLKKKGTIDEKAIDNPRQEPGRSCINQINFSFFINEVKIQGTSDRKKLTSPKKRKEQSQVNCQKRTIATKGTSIERPPRHPVSLNSLLPTNTQVKTIGAVSIGNLKELLNRKRKND